MEAPLFKPINFEGFKMSDNGSKKSYLSAGQHVKLTLYIDKHKGELNGLSATQLADVLTKHLAEINEVDNQGQPAKCSRYGAQQLAEAFKLTLVKNQRGSATLKQLENRVKELERIVRELEKKVKQPLFGG